MAAEASTGHGEVAAAGITLEVPRAAAGQIGSGSALEKGKAAVADVRFDFNIPPRIDLATMKKRKVSSRRLGPVASRLAHKAAIRKKKVVVEVPNGENIVTVADVADILARRNRGEPLCSQFIHEADVFSKPPGVLVQEFAGCTLWKDQFGNTKLVSLFTDSVPASYGEKKRSRVVGGSGREENGKWHADHKAKPIKEFLWASKTQYYYRINCSTEKPRGERTGWCMTEFSLTDQKLGNYLVCKVYQSNRSHPETPTADSRSTAAETPTIVQEHDEAEEEENGASVDSSLGSPGAGSDTGLAIIANLLMQAADNAKSCGDVKKACEINEFVAVKDQFHRLIDDLGLDRFIISELLDELKIRLQHVAMNKELSPKEGDVIVSYGLHMWKTVYSAHFDKCVRQSGLSPKVEGAENERRSSLVNSSAGASSSGLKRKAGHNHTEPPPSVRQDLTDKDRELLNEAERFLSFDDEMAAGASQATVYADNVDGSVLQAELQRLVEGGNRLGTEEEVTETLEADCWSHGGLPDLSIGDMSCPAPGFADGSHVAEESQAVESWSPGGFLEMNIDEVSVGTNLVS